MTTQTNRQTRRAASKAAPKPATGNEVSLATDVARDMEKPTEGTSTVPQTALPEGMTPESAVAEFQAGEQERVKATLPIPSKAPLSDHVSSIGNVPLTAEQAAKALETVAPSMSAESQNVERIKQEAERAASGQTTLAGIGHNQGPKVELPEKTKIIDLGDSKTLVVRNPAYEPVATNFAALTDEATLFVREYDTAKNLGESVQARAINWAVDYMTLCQNLKQSEKGSYTIRGVHYIAEKMPNFTADKNDKKNGIPALRSALNAVLTSELFAYKPHTTGLDTVKEGKGETLVFDSDTTQDGREPSKAWIATLKNTAVDAAVLVYYGAFGFTTGYFLDKAGIALTGDDLIAARAAGKELKRRAAYDLSTIIPAYTVMGKTHMTDRGILKLASSKVIKEAMSVFNGDKEFDPVTGDIKAVKRGTQIAAVTETAEEKAKREAADKLANESKLVRASDFIGEKSVAPANETPEAKIAREAADRLAKARAICEAIKPSVAIAFPLADKANHDLDLASQVFLATVELIKVMDWGSKRLAKHDALQDAMAELNRLCSQVTESDSVNGKTTRAA